MTTSVLIDGYDLIANGWTVVEGTSFPTAEVAQWGKDLQTAGFTTPASSLLDAPFSVALHKEATTASALAEEMKSLGRRFQPDSVLTVGYGGNQPGSCAIRTVNLPQRDVRHDTPTEGTLTITGTREGPWNGRVIPVASQATPIALTLFGSAALDSTPDGDLDAAATIYATPLQATNLLTLGFKSSAATGYDPIDDYSGTSDATAFGGARSTDVVTAATGTALGTAPTIDVDANRGEHIVLARVKSSSATATFKAESRVAPAIGAAVSELEPAVAAGGTALKTLNLGRVSVPVQDVPDSGRSSSWTSTTTLDQSHTGATGQVSTAGALWEAGTVTYNGSGILDLEVECSASGAGHLSIALCTPYAGGGWSSWTTFDADFAASAGWSYLRLTRGVLAGVPAGTYTLVVYTAATVSVRAHSAASTVIDGLNYKLYQASPISFPATTPVQCFSSGASGSVDVLARIPADEFGFTVSRTAASGQGCVVQDGQMFLADSSGNIGATLAAVGSIFGVYDGPLPGVTNTLVAAADTGATLPTTVSVWGSYTERWSDLQRSV